MAKTVTGVDVGLRNARFLRGSFKGNTFHATGYRAVPLESKEIAEGWASADPGFKPLSARVGLTGKDVNIRYTRVPRVPDWQLKNLMRFEVEEIGDQSGSGLASDFNLLPPLPEIEGEDVVLLAMARESLLEAHAAGLEKLGGKLEAFSPNAIALYNAWIRFGVVQDETVLLANVGYDNIDVVIARGPDLIFARNLTGGSRLFEDALAQRFGVSTEKAVELKETVATLEPGARFADANQEKASRAVLGAAGQLLSLLQSTVLFCKSQVKVSSLKLDRVLLCGGGSALTGLTHYLSTGMQVPVELFDPWRVVDVSGLDAEAADELERYKLESVVVLGLATMASDPEAYSIDILPAKLRKRREFAEGPAWLVAAGVLALGFLGYDAWRTSSELTATTEARRVLDARVKKASQTHRKAEELVAENARLEELGQTLFALKGSGEQLARTIGALERDLPDDFWVAQLSSDFRADPELRIARGAERPIVSISGKAREGTASLSTLYEGFVRGLREKLPKEAALRERLTPNGSKFTVDLSLFAPPPPPSDAGGEPTAPEKTAPPKKGAKAPARN